MNLLSQDLIIHITFSLGLLFFILDLFIKLMNNYSLITRILSILLLGYSLYLEGGLNNDLKWQEKVKELENKVKIMEEQSNVVNTKIETQVVEKIKVINHNVDKIHNIIQIKEKIINADCKLNPIAIKLYNNAVKNGNNKHD